MGKQPVAKLLPPQANELQSIINKQKTELERLGRHRVIIRINYLSGQGDTLFSTIGTEDNCEHPDADLAQSFLKQMIQRREDALSEAQRQFNAL